MVAAIAPLGIALLSLILRLVNLGHPKGFVFDEVYYVDGARDYLAHGVEIAGSKAEFVVHPPVGKWLIAIGIKIFGNNEFGWRFATALCGTLLILLFARMVHTLFYSPFITALAASLMAMDGMQLVHSRTALLDLFLTFFVLGAVYFWHRNRHWLAGISIGLACATKWSALYFLIVIILISAYRIFRDYPLREMPRAIGLKFMTYVLLPISIYISSWVGWFTSDRGWDRQWSTNALKSLWHYHAEMLGFHTGLIEKHSYQANPWSWLVMGRPTSFFYAAPKGCGEKECAQEVLALGTPLLWWIGTIALVVVFGYWIRSLMLRKNQPVLNLIMIGLGAGYLPWFFFQKRTVFTFYAIVIEPFMILAILYCANLFLKSSRDIKSARLVIALITVLIFICFIYFLPLFTGQVITYDAWHHKMWLPSWI